MRVARGNGGQDVFVSPSPGVTEAFTGSFYNDGGSTLLLMLLRRCVVPAVPGLDRPKVPGDSGAPGPRVLRQTVVARAASGF